MAHFAKVVDGIVTDVIVAEQDFIDTLDGTWIQTSYNTRGGIHYLPNSQTPSGQPALRKNYAGIGMVYDSDRDAFYHPQPFASWSLDEDTCLWKPPVDYPDDGNYYVWREDSQQWILEE